MLISGSSPFCETFFTDVKVPKGNLMGPLNGGWTVGKRLLQHERNGLSGGGDGRLRFDPKTLREAAKRYIGVDEDGRLADSDFRTRLVTHDMEARSFQLTLLRAAAEARNSNGPSAATSIMKNANSKVGTDHCELMVEAMGQRGLGWNDDDFTSEEKAAQRQYLRIKSSTIAGGSYEIQNNIISKRILGLPDTNKHTY